MVSSVQSGKEASVRRSGATTIGKNARGGSEEFQKPPSSSSARFFCIIITTVRESVGVVLIDVTLGH